MEYDYLGAVEDDVKEYIKDEVNFADYETMEELEQFLNDELFINDNVTGNGSGSYTFDKWEAEENLCHNMDLLADALEEFDCDRDYLKRGAEACDVTIRCYLLSQAISEVLEELEEDFEAVHENEEEIS